MKSEYIDLVIAKSSDGKRSVFIVPAWSNLGIGDKVQSGDYGPLFSVLLSDTVMPHDHEYNMILCTTGDLPERATAYYKCNNIVWEEDKPDESAAE